MPERDDVTFTTSLLHQASDPYRLFVDSVREYAIYLLDPAGRIVSWNTAAERIKGFPAADVLGQPFDMMFAPEAVAAGHPQRGLEAALATGTFEDEGPRSRKDGTSFLGIYTITALYEAGRHIGFAVIVRDVTKKRQQEQALRRSERRYRSLIEAAGMIVWSAAPDGSVASEMTGWREFSGMAEKQTAGWGWLDAVHPEDRDGAADRWSAAVASHLPYRSEYRMRREDGQWRYIVARAAPVKNEQGEVVEWIGVCEDVTDTRLADIEVRDSERRYRALVENSWDGVLLVDDHCKILDITPAGERLLGYKRDELVGKSAFDVVFAGSLEDAQDVFQRILNAPSTPILTEQEMQHRDSSTRWLEFSVINLLHEPSVSAVVANFRDVTSQKELQRQYLQAQKMEALGRLAAGVAHDFNNILTVINSYCELLLGDQRIEGQDREFVSEIENAGYRAEALTRQLLSFSRQNVTQESILSLNTVLGGVESMIRRLLGAAVKLEIELAPDLELVIADQGQIEQALLNLVVNARDAMPQGGCLRIQTANAPLDESFCLTRPGLKPGAYVSLSVSDTGVGMEESTKSRLFEPFFTTKEVGKGTGLGLATVYSIVEQSAGHIECQSELGVGTEFTIYLPQSQAPASLGPDAHAVRSTKGHETILVVEDEESVRLLMRRTLEGRGYAVREAHDGLEAVRILEGQDDIDLIISDLMMPRLGGRGLLERYATLRPSCKVLLVSGYTNDEVARRWIESRSCEFLQKPLTPAFLLDKVRSMLDQQA